MILKCSSTTYVPVRNSTEFIWLLPVTTSITVLNFWIWALSHRKLTIDVSAKMHYNIKCSPGFLSNYFWSTIIKVSTANLNIISTTVSLLANNRQKAKGESYCLCWVDFNSPRTIGIIGICRQRDRAPRPSQHSTTYCTTQKKNRYSIRLVYAIARGRCGGTIQYTFYFSVCAETISGIDDISMKIN